MNIGETIKDDELFRKLAKYFVSKSSEPEEGDDPDFIKFYESALDVVTTESVEAIIHLSESPIERMFLGSLLLGSIKWFPYGMVVHQFYKDTRAELDSFLNYLSKFFEFLEWYENKHGSYAGIDVFLDNEVSIGKMEPEERTQIGKLIFRYVYLGLKDSWHITLQPKFPDILVNDKSIRPDIFLWIPSNQNKRIIVECDGYQYHSNKESFTSDRVRDRTTSSLGFQTYRFSGSEIHKKTSEVAIELLNLLDPDAEINEI